MGKLQAAGRLAGVSSQHFFPTEPGGFPGQFIVDEWWETLGGFSLTFRPPPAARRCCLELTATVFLLQLLVLFGVLLGEDLDA